MTPAELIVFAVLWGPLCLFAAVVIVVNLIPEKLWRRLTRPRARRPGLCEWVR